MGGRGLGGRRGRLVFLGGRVVVAVTVDDELDAEEEEVADIGDGWALGLELV